MDIALAKCVQRSTIPGVYEYWNTFPEGAVVAAGDVYIISHGSADPAILAKLIGFILSDTGTVI